MAQHTGDTGWGVRSGLGRKVDEGSHSPAEQNQVRPGKCSVGAGTQVAVPGGRAMRPQQAPAGATRFASRHACGCPAKRVVGQHGAEWAENFGSRAKQRRMQCGPLSQAKGAKDWQRRHTRV